MNKHCIVTACLLAGCGMHPTGASTGDDQGVDAGVDAGPGGTSGSAATGATASRNLYRIAGGEWPISGGIAVAWSGGTLTTYDPITGVAHGSRTLPADTVVVGTTDLDGDGLADVATFHNAPAASPCAAGALDRSVAIYSGANPSATLYAGTIPDTCISINGASPTAYTAMWPGALQGGVAGTVVLAPQYYVNGWFVRPGAADYFYTPQTSSFAAYSAARPLLEPSASGNSYMQFSQPFNGFTVNVSGQNRYVAATSGRFLQFDLTAYSASQLHSDSPFLARPDIVGRTYGLLQQDVEGDATHVALIAGTAACDLYQDVIAGSASNTVAGTDVWGAIERHVSMLDLASDTVEQSFYSYAHDPFAGSPDAFTYRQRVTYPSFARLPSKTGPSQLIYNVFDGTTWNIHISAPGGVADATVVSNYYVWDVIPRGPDAVDVLASPVDLARSVYIPDYMVPNTSTVGSWRHATYFPQFTTSVFRWTRDAGQFQQLKTVPGIPRMNVVFPRRTTESASSGVLFPSLRTANTNDQTVLLMTQADLTSSEQVIDW